MTTYQEPFGPPGRALLASLLNIRPPSAMTAIPVVPKQKSYNLHWMVLVI